MMHQFARIVSVCVCVLSAMFGLKSNMSMAEILQSSKNGLWLRCICAVVSFAARRGKPRSEEQTIKSMAWKMHIAQARPKRSNTTTLLYLRSFGCRLYFKYIYASML